jgi:serine/threonine-protein kinase
VLFTSHSSTNGFDGANIEVVSLKDHLKKTLQRGGTYGRYLPSGHLVYINRGTLFAVPFDLEHLEVHGTPSPLLDEVGFSAGYGSGQIDFSRAGTAVFQNGGNGNEMFTVQWLDASGKTEPLLAKPGMYQTPRFSPDGKRLAMAVTAGTNQDIWIYDLERETPTSLTFGGGAYLYPIWSPDGRYVVFQTPEGMSWTRSDGGSKAQVLSESKPIQYPWSFTPDSKRLAYLEIGQGTGFDIWILPLENDKSELKPAGKPEAFLHEPFDERHPSFSPDGKWIAYSSNEQGAFQVYVRAFPDRGGRWPISNAGGVYPVWSRNGHDLFFRTEDNHLMVTSYTVKGDTFVADKPRVWSEKRLANVGLFQNYDVSPNGNRVAALMPVDAPGEQKAQNHVVFLENFFDEVRRRGGK